MVFRGVRASFLDVRPSTHVEENTKRSAHNNRCVVSDEDPCSIDTGRDPAAQASCSVVDGVRLKVPARHSRSAFPRTIEWGHRTCCEHCAAEPAGGRAATSGEI